MPKKDDYEGVGAIWINESDKGKRYLTISMDDPEDKDNKLKYVAFKVKEKTSDKSPDYVIFNSKPMDKKSSKSKKRDEEEEDDDDL